MPWTMSSASKFTRKASSPAAKKQWATVANKVLADSGDDGKAARIANAAVANRRKPPNKNVGRKRGK